MKTLSRNLVAALVLLLSGGHTTIADTSTPRQFDIELLIFQNLVDADGGEVWPIDYSTWFEDVAEVPSGEANEPVAVTWLPQETYHLTAERNALGRSSRYRPLAYLAWRQAVYDRNQARPLTLPTRENATGSYVDGTVKVAVERYLHLYLDLQLHLPAESGAVELPEIRLTEKRRMRSQEVHYFDNPRFGVIALITPYEPEPEPAPEPEPPAATAGDTDTPAAPTSP